MCQYNLIKLNCIYKRCPKIYIDRRSQPLKASAYWVKTKITQRMNSDGVLLSFTANSICCCQNLINMHNFSSTPVSQEVQWLPPHSHSPKMSITLVTSFYVTPCPSLAAHGGGAPVLSATGETRPVTATGSETPTNGRGRATVRPYGCLLPYLKRGPAQFKKCFKSPRQVKKNPSKRLTVCLWSC